MIKAIGTDSRSLRQVKAQADLVIVGGGLAGCCAAITAARKGIKVILVQDRPVLGGNSSSEVRLWVLGATSHMGNNNRWAREGGVIDELLVENMYRNAEGNPVLFDGILLDKVVSESNISLYLNTGVFEVIKSGPETISAVRAFCSQNSTEYLFEAPLFCDASGDGVVGFLSGAAFRMGAESQDEFGEKFAPSAEYGELLGHSLYFYSKDTGKPVKYVAPQFALQDITKIPRFKSFNSQEFGCKLWWIEYGGRLDTVHETETIKWELWKVVYGVWNYIKNSGKFPEAENLTLEWVGMIPGKRESRRFEGDYLLRQQDIIEQRTHPDAVAFGGWSVDLHPADGVFSEKPGCNQWHSKGIYQIPYRCFYSKNISNLFLAGRIISATHVAFGSCRVMGTSAYGAQAVGMAAYLCKQYGLSPAGLLQEDRMAELQSQLARAGQHIPGFTLQDDNDLVSRAQISATSTMELKAIPADGPLKPLNIASGQLIPLVKGSRPKIELTAVADETTTLDIELRISSKPGNFTPDVTLDKKQFSLQPGNNKLVVDFSDVELFETGYAFLLLQKNATVSIPCSDLRATGLLSVFNTVNEAVSNYGKQTPPEDIGMEAFEFWCPQRRPEGHNLALSFEPALHPYAAVDVSSGVDRPTTKPHAWVADLADPSPSLTITWDEPQRIKTIELVFDTDMDHPMETVLIHHPDSVMPFCVREYSIVDDQGNVVYQRDDNHQTRNVVVLPGAVITSKLTIYVKHPSANVPAALFAVRCYSN